MDPHALRTLEFDKILAKLARSTSFSAGRELALALTPSTDFGEVVLRQRETAEARRLIQMKPRTGLGGAHDVRPLAEKAARGGLLDPDNLLQIASTLECARELKNSISRLDEELPLLAEVADGIEPLVRVVEDINRCINPRGEVTDQASPALGALRRQIRALHDRLYQRMQEILGASFSKGIAQEAIITLRDGRYVIPIKADMRGQLKGIVHDVSGSGATVWLEPLAVVELGNKWREAQIEEEREVERVLKELSSSVGAVAEAIGWDVEALARIDLALAKARFGDEIGAPELPYAGADQSWIVEAPAQLHLLLARHPLLRAPVIPTTVTVGGNYRVLLITGPNTGGKTVALKTAGLLSLMAQAGLPVPADTGSRVPVFAAIFADIGDEQSIEQSLSTFSSHMTNIIHIVDAAGPKSLVLLDELAAGTDPTEGSALARALLAELLEVGALTVATTHHGELKVFAHSTDGVMNASVEFNLETLSPTYHLTIGLPGRSNALEIAQRLGMPREIIDEARKSIAPEQLQVEELLSDMRREREQAASARRSEEIARREAEEIRGRLAEKLEGVEDERARMLDQAKTDIDRDIDRARKLLAEAEQQVEQQKLAAAAEKLRQAAGEAAKIAARAAQPRPVRRQPVPRARSERARQARRPHRSASATWCGCAAWTSGQKRSASRKMATSKCDSARCAAASSSRRWSACSAPRRRKRRATSRTNVAPPRAVPPEIEVRGQTIDEAIPTVEQYIDEAFRAGLPWARIIHGKGTGTLRRQVRDLLSKHPLVKSYEEAKREEGGEGVTIAHLAV